MLIPIVIHLFNFRKYKKVYFPDTRLLQSLQTRSRRQSKVQNWWLLLSRILFLTALVLAFAQPFLGQQAGPEKSIHIVYVDNSLSMQATKGSQINLLQQAKDAAIQLVESGTNEQEYVVLSNNNIYATRPIYKPEALKLLQELQLSSKSVSLEQINKALETVAQNNNSKQNKVYIFSDLQESTFLAGSPLKTKSDNTYYIFPQTQKTLPNIFIDTAYFANPVLDSKQNNPLVVHLKKVGSDAKETNVQVLVNNQTRAAKSLKFKNDSIAVDTLQIAVNASGWQKIDVAIADENILFDDTFHISAKTNATLSILELSDGASSPYLLAAFSPASGFMTQRQSLSALGQSDLSAYNMIVAQLGPSFSSPVAMKLRTALDNGQTVFLVPQSNMNIATVNAALSAIAPINFGASDTARQQVGNVQTEHPLLNDVVVSMPANVQLPIILYHYPISSGINASQQNILSLKNGRPLLAQFSVGSGKMFIVSSPLNEQAGNFVLSPLFMPLLYKMSTQSGAQSIYAINANSNQPVFVPLKTGSRSVFKIVGNGAEGIPPQTPYGNGTNIFSGNVLNASGYYKLLQDGSSDSTIIAVNNDNKESILNIANKKSIENALQGSEVIWKANGDARTTNTNSEKTPIWKWLVGLGLFALVIETILLIRNKKGTASEAIPSPIKS